MTISQLQDKLFLLANTHGDMKIFISDPDSDFYEPLHFEEISLRESDVKDIGYPHLQFHVPR